MKPFIVAEISGNHANDWDHCMRLLQTCANANVSAIKTQHYTPDSITIKSDRAEFFLTDTLWKGRTLYDIYAEGAMPFAWQSRVLKFCDDHNLEFMCTPFDSKCVDQLVKIGCKNLKVASSEANDTNLLEKVFSATNNAFVSIGMASIEEIDRIYDTFSTSSAEVLTLLQCTAAYPAPIADANLQRLKYLQNHYDCRLGLSDHTLGTTLPLIALGAGATVFEKHVTLDRGDGALDSAFSLEPSELNTLVEQLNAYSDALGSSNFGPTQSERTAYKYRRSLYIVRDVLQGQVLTKEDVRSIRPANGISPHLLTKVVGLPAACNLKAGTPLQLDHVVGATL